MSLPMVAVADGVPQASAAGYNPYGGPPGGFGGKGSGKGKSGGGFKGAPPAAQVCPWDPRRPPPGTGRGGVGGSIPAQAVGMAGRGGIMPPMPQPAPGSQGRGVVVGGAGGAPGGAPGGGRGGVGSAPAAAPAPAASSFVKRPPGGTPKAPPPAGGRGTASGGRGSGGRGAGRGQANARGAASAGRGSAEAKARPAVIPPHMDCAPPPLPFAGALDRSVVEHCARHPRRRVPHELKGVRPHWVQAKAGRLGEMLDSTVPFSLDAEEALPPPSQPANGDAAAGSTNVRAILVLGRKTPESLRNAAHALHRIEVLAANFHDGTKSLPRAYGGLVAKKKPTDAALVKALKDFIKEQSGIDLSKVTQWTKLVEFQYTDRPTTVFFVPDLSGVGEEGLKARRCCKEVKYEVEVEETVEEGEIEVDGEAQKVTKKRKVKQEKTKQQQVVGPRKTTLGQLLETEAAAGADPQTAELLAAADVLDEWLQRDMATRLCSFLEERHAKFLAEEAEQKEHQEAAEGRKRKREADGESAKRQRKEQQELLQAKWEAEDVSASEQDKSAAQAERDAELQQLAEAESAVLQKLKEQEEADAKAAEEAAKERAEKKKTPVPEGMQLVHVRDWGLFDAFQTFDRPRTGVNHTPQAPHALYQEYLAQCLLALNDGKSLRQCKAMTKRGAGWSFNYHIAAQTDKFVEKKEKKENGDKTAAAAEAEAATAAEGEAAGEGAEGAAGEEPAAEATPAEGEQEGAEGAGEETKQDAAEGEGNAEAEDMEEGEA